MNSMHKVLVVDSGRRGETDLLSTELAELGLSSVTTSLEAAEDVLAVIERPSAIFVNMPRETEGFDALRALAASLRCNERAAGVPVIEWDRNAALKVGGVSAILRSEIGAQGLQTGKA